MLLNDHNMFLHIIYYQLYPTFLFYYLNYHLTLNDQIWERIYKLTHLLYVHEMFIYIFWVYNKYDQHISIQVVVQ